jgi:CheY-like chemotaxis protein
MDTRWEINFGIGNALKQGGISPPTYMPTSDPNQEKETPVASAEFVAKTTSELNNLLQIISGSSAALEKMSANEQESAEYREMLRASLNRAELLGEELAKRSGGTREKAICNPNTTAFGKNEKGAKTPRSPQTILVVDDEKMAVTLMERLLREAGYEVVAAQSGFECIDLLRKEPHRYALVLLDFSLPFMDGKETFRRLREIRNNIAVILVTGFILQERLTEMMQAGLAGFLRKPVPPDELLSVVRTTLQSARYSRDPNGMSIAG